MDTSAHPTQILDQLRHIVGNQQVLTGAENMRRYLKGYRYGEGNALAVIRPGTLVEQWRVFKAAVEAGLVVIMQAANTGLTGGSTPFGDAYDRDLIVINTLRINRIDLIQNGQQVLCLAGSTLHHLQEKLGPLGREPHSVIGSTTIGATVIGGVCNNSGGSLIRRGPAFTQLALFARVDEFGRASLVNHLGIDLGSDPEQILDRLDRGSYEESDILSDGIGLASDPDYQSIIRDIDSPRPARYNNDPRLLYETSGCAGKLCVFAVRLDTFPSSGPTKVFYLGSNDFYEFTKIRRHILSNFVHLPVAAEYLHRDAYSLAEIYGKDLYLFLKYLGPSRIPTAFAVKNWFDGITSRVGLGANVSDRLLQLVSRHLPHHLPARMNAFRDAYEHHLLLRVDGGGIKEARAYLSSTLPSSTGAAFECTAQEADAAFRHRYAVAGAPIRHRALHPGQVEDIMALDVALPRNALDWRVVLPPDVEEDIENRSIYGHFFCHVFHCDYSVKRGVDWLNVEQHVVRHLEKQGIALPSEHNVGHLYNAKSALADFYRSLDPTNTLNPGIGETSKNKNWEWLEERNSNPVA